PARPSSPVPAPIVVSVLPSDPTHEIAKAGGGSPSRSSGRAMHVRARGDAWAGLSIRTEGRGHEAGGNGGTGGGHGRGIGLGDGGGVETAQPVPPPPAPPPPSRARPARLIFPSRHQDVDDDAHLFVAVVTV